MGFRIIIRFFEEMGSDYRVVNDCGKNLPHTLASREIIKVWMFDNYGSNLTLFKNFVQHELDPLAQNKKGCSALVGDSIRTTVAHLGS